MKIKIPLIGEVKIREPGAENTQSIASVPIESPSNVKKTYDVLGGFLSLNKFGLSSEKTISSRILEANMGWVYRNNDAIAQEVAAIEFELFSVNLRGGEIEFDQIEEHPLLDLLYKFNSRTTKADGIYMTQSHKKLTGDAFWLLDKNGKAVENIFVLPPDKMELVLADPTDSTAELIKEYIYTDTIDNKQIKETYQLDQIIHFKKPNPKNPFRGYGAVEALADTIDSDNLVNQVQRNFFEKGAISNFVLTSDANITDEQLKRLKAELRAMYGGANNAFNTMIFGNGLKPADIGFSNKDMDFLNLLEWYRDKIMIGFGNTKASIGIIDDVNRASYEGSIAGWLRGTVKPDMDSIIQTINEFLVPQFGDNLILGYKDPIPENTTEEAERAVKLKEAGIIQINEAREMVGLSPVAGMDVFTDQTDPATQEVVDEAKKVRQAHLAVPKSIRHMDYIPILRRRGMYFKKKFNKEIKELALPVIKNTLKNRKTVKKEISTDKFTEEEITKYYEKQMNLVDAYEKQFNDKVFDLLTSIKEQAMENVGSELKSVKALQKRLVKKELFDAKEIKVQAQLDLNPILTSIVTLAGDEAYRLIGIDDVYVPYKMEDNLKVMIDKFSDSMIETDKEKLAKIISEGAEAGDSIEDIRSAINTDFGDFTVGQATRITRTEVLRASSMAAQDAFIQSGIVEAKQWLTAPVACSICAPYSDKIVKLTSDFYSADSSGFQDGNPPLHPNCRCVLIPIVKGVDKNVLPERDTQHLVDRIKELESKVDKRTKAYRDLKKTSSEQNADNISYIKALESHLGLDNE